MSNLDFTRVVLAIATASYANELKASWCQNGVITNDSICCPKSCGNDCQCKRKTRGGSSGQCCPLFWKQCKNFMETACMVPFVSGSVHVEQHEEYGSTHDGSERGLLQQDSMSSVSYDLCLAASHQVPMPCQNPNHRSHLFHLHIAKMAGRTIMRDGPQWFEMPDCNWIAEGEFYDHTPNFVKSVRSHASTSSSCFSSYEGNWDEIVPSFGPTPVLVAVVLREATSWAKSAAAHFQRPNIYNGNICVPFPCHRNNGIDDLVSSGCFFEPGRSKPAGFNESKCSAQYNFPEFSLMRLTNETSINQSEIALVRPFFERARLHLESALVGTTEHLAATLCLWRFQLGLSLAIEPCASLCPSPSETQGYRNGTGSSRRVLHPNQAHSYLGALNISHESNPEQTLHLIAPEVKLTIGEQGRSTLARSMSLHEKLHIHAEDLLRSRARAVEAVTGIRLFC